MGHVRYLALLLLCSVASAQTYYPKTTTSPVKYVSCVNNYAVDDALLTKAFAAAGGIVLQGNCEVAVPMTMISNTDFNGNGYTVTAAAAARWPSSVIGHFIDAAHSASNLTVQNTNFNWTGAASNNHILHFGAVGGGEGNNSKINVLNNVAIAPGDFISVISGSYVTEIGNYASGCTGACYDHWYNTGDVKSIGNIASLPLLTDPLQSGYGFIFTGYATDEVTITNATHYDVSHNTVYINGQPAFGQVGVYIQGFLGACASNGTFYNNVSDNHIIVASGVWGTGIYVDGCSGYTDIHDNTITSDGATTSSNPAIFAQATTIGVRIHDNMVINWKGQTSTSNQGIFSNRGSKGSLMNNTCLAISPGVCTSPTEYIGSSTTNQLFGNTAGTGVLESGNDLGVAASGQFYWNARGILTSPAVNQIQLGAANSATPSNQTVLTQSSRGGTDADVAGGNLTIASGEGTGAATGSTMTLSTPTATSTGTTAQTYVARIILSDGVVTLHNSDKLVWQARGALTSPAAGQIQLGAADAASPVAQTVLTQNSRGGTDTNTAGANLTIQSGLGTGSATGSTLTLQTPKAGSTGTTQETAVNGLVLSDTAISIGNATSNPAASFLGSGTVAHAGRITGALGLTVSGATVSLNDSSNFATNINTTTSTGTVTIGQNSATPSAIALNGPVSFQAGTAFSGASWGTTSPVWNGVAMTLNDTTASGTDASEVAYSLQAPNFTSTGGASTTITNATTLWVAPPTCSGGVVCTNLNAIQSTGAVRFSGGSTLNGTQNINSSNNAATNIGNGTTNSNVAIGGASNLVVLGPTEINSGTKFTTGNFSGCSVTNGTPGTTVGGPQAGKFVANSHGTTCSVTITINGATGKTAANGWVCFGSDTTTGVALTQSGTSTTTCTLLGTVNADADTIAFMAMGY